MAQNIFYTFFGALFASSWWSLTVMPSFEQKNSQIVIPILTTLVFIGWWGVQIKHHWDDKG